MNCDPVEPIPVDARRRDVVECGRESHSYCIRCRAYEAAVKRNRNQVPKREGFGVVEINRPIPDRIVYRTAKKMDGSRRIPGATRDRDRRATAALAVGFAVIRKQLNGVNAATTNTHPLFAISLAY